MRKHKRLFVVLLALTLACTAAAFAVGCNNKGKDPGGNTNPPAPKAPTAITVTNGANPKPGAFKLAVTVTPTDAVATFTSVLKGTHTLVYLEDNEVTIAETIADKYEFIIEVTSTADTTVKAEKTFTVDNRPEEGLFITTAQRIVDAEQNEGKLQLGFTMYPAADVTFALEEAVDGVTLSESGLITLDANVDNKVPFKVTASALVDGKPYTASVDMTTKNEVYRAIASEADLRAIWTDKTDAASMRHMKNNYRLTNNIVLSEPWKAIGYWTSDSDCAAFEGIFDGNGYTISEFNMNAGWNNGFFSIVGADGRIENLRITSGKTAGKGMRGLFAGTFAGKLQGKILNCIADVRVQSDANSAGTHQPVGTFVGAIDVGALISNCVSLGQAVIDKTGENEDPARNTGFAASLLASDPATVIKSVFMLEGTANGLVGHDGASFALENFFKTELELKNAATYPQLDAKGLGFDRTIWRIVDGVYPSLLNDKFVEPQAVTVTFNGAALDADSIVAIGNGSYDLAAVVTAGDSMNCPQDILVTLTPADGVDADAFKYADGKVLVNGLKAKEGDACAITVASAYAPAVKVSATLVFELGQLGVVLEFPENVEYTANGDNSFDLNDYVSLIGATESTEVSFALEGTHEGVTLTAEGILTLTAASNNTDALVITVTASNGEDPVTGDPATLVIKNLVAKEIGTAEAFAAIWTGDNDLSKLHMYNNYILTANVDLGTTAKAIGLGIDNYNAKDPDYTKRGYGLFGTLDGNGYTLSWTNAVSVSWNSGFIMKVESTGVIKNLKLKGSMVGVITGPIGYVCGTVENCLFDVAVKTTHASQPSASAVAFVGKGGIVRNCIAIGTVTGNDNNLYANSAVFGKTHYATATSKATVSNLFALEGTVSLATASDKENVAESNVGIKTETELKTPATFEGWNTAVWNFTADAFPSLIAGCTTNA